MKPVIPLRILLVDDNNDFVKAFMHLIQSTYGYRINCIDIASNGAEAIKKVEQKLYDIIFMDIDMPVLDGIEATRYLNRHYNHIRIIALSGHYEMELMTRIISAGAKTYLCKDKLTEESLKRAFSVLEKVKI
jgi:CheY-like chemotaxis protein